MIDSILIYQHIQTRMYFAILSSNSRINSDTVCKSPSEAVKQLGSYPSVMGGGGWILVDKLTSDIYPELFL